MSKAKDSSFLDPKLQHNLTKSLRIHSKLRAPSTVTKDANVDSRKSIFTQGLNLRSSRSSTIVSNNNNDMMMKMIKKLIEIEPVFNIIASMLQGSDLKKLQQIKAAKVSKVIGSDAKDQSRITTQRKARNLFKEDLLYSTGKKMDRSEEIIEIQDYEQIIREIEELKSEKIKLSTDINKCEQFIQLKSSSFYFRFKYLLTKLHFIRKCTQLGSVSMLTADYFSVVLDKRKEMMDCVQNEMANIQNTMDQINELRSKFQTEVSSFLDVIDKVDKDNSVASGQVRELERKAFADQLAPDRKLDLLDEKLGIIIRTFREKVANNVPKKIKEKEKMEVELNYDPAVTVEDVVRSSAANFDKFRDNVKDTMQRCFALTEGRLQRLEASRRALMEEKSVPQSDRIVKSVHEIHQHTEERQKSLTRMVTLEESLRTSAEQAFEDRTRSLLSAVAQSEQASLNHLKTHYHNLYAKSPSRARRRSTALL